MTTLGSINSQNRVANYSANYRGSLSLPLPSRSSAPVIHRIHRLSSLSADYLSPRLIADKIRPSGFFPFLPSPFICPAFCHARLIGFGIGGMRNLQKQASKTHRTVAHRADAHDSAPRAGIVWCATAPPILNRVRSGLENAWSASRGLTGSPVDSLAKWMGIRKAKVPLVHRLSSLRFSPSPSFLSLPFFSPFHFHFDRQGGQGGRGERHMPR